MAIALHIMNVNNVAETTNYCTEQTEVKTCSDYDCKPYTCDYDGTCRTSCSFDSDCYFNYKCIKRNGSITGYCA